MRLLPIACLTVLAASPAAAKPVRPIDGLLAPAPPALQVQQGPLIARVHVTGHADEIVACTRHSRATVIRARVALRWDGQARIQRATVLGGNPLFNRCASRALRGTINGVDHRGAALVRFLVRKPDNKAPDTFAVPPPDPAPATAGLQTCQADTDCTLHFRSHGCVSGDPVAVNTSADRKAVLDAFPVRHDACAMGGPQYEQLRMSNEGRYSAACEQSRCVARDHGPQKTIFDRMR